MFRRSQALIYFFVLQLSAMLLADYSAAAEYRSVTVADAYLELHTGAGEGYPITHVAERGETVEIIRRKTNWFLLRTQRGKQGWVELGALQRTLDENGELMQIERIGRAAFAQRRWEAGVLTGDFQGADALAAYAGFSFTPNLSVELWGTQLIGNFSNGYMATVNLVHETWPQWRVSPYFTLGTGVVRTEPKSTLVQAPDRSDQVALVGVGARAYLTRRFVLRAEYKSYVVLTSRDENEEVDEWKIGFGFFF